MPGISAPSRLSMRMKTGNIVTLCCTVACGEIFSTTPWKVRFGYASTFTVAVCPGLHVADVALGDERAVHDLGEVRELAGASCRR